MSAMIEKVSMYYPRALHGDGGVTNSLWLWAESLTRAGVEVDILYDSRLPLSTARSVPLRVHTRPVTHCGRGRLAVPLNLARELSPSALLILHSGYVLFNIVAAEVATRLGVPYAVMPHGAYDPHVRVSRRVVRTVWDVAERRLLKHALAAHIFFQPEADHVRRLAPTAVTVIAPTAFELPDAGWKQESARDYVAWLGRYDVRHKGLDRLLDAMVLLPPNRRPLLRLHGRDHQDSRSVVQLMVIERGLSDHVSVGGPVDGQDKEQLLLNAAAYVHPARWESYGIALVENLARGVPCLTTTDINLGPELKEAGAALVVDGNAAGLAQGLAAVAAGAVTAYGARGRAFVRNHLSHAAAGKKFLQGMAALTRVEAIGIEAAR